MKQADNNPFQPTGRYRFLIFSFWSVPRRVSRGVKA